MFDKICDLFVNGNTFMFIFVNVCLVRTWRAGTLRAHAKCEMKHSRISTSEVHASLSRVQKTLRFQRSSPGTLGLFSPKLTNKSGFDEQGGCASSRLDDDLVLSHKRGRLR